MEPESVGSKNVAPRKVRFAPKVPQRRAPKPAATKIEVLEETEASLTSDLLKRINEGSGRGRPKVEKKAAQVHVAFGYGGSSNSMRSYGPPRGGSNSRSQEGTNSSVRNEKEYKEPWNYYSYYPVTLPLRRPYSGDPVLLDEEEFGEASANITYDENSTKPAYELGLMEENDSMIFLQLPTSLPLMKRSATVEENVEAHNSKPPKGMGPSEKACKMEELPPGFMGKMLVYESGAIKLKLGDTLYDVSSGSNCMFSQDVVAINTEAKQCALIGELTKRAVLTPDVDSLLDSMAALG